MNCADDRKSERVGTQPWDANREAFAGYRKAVAEATGVSVSLIDKMTKEPKPTGDGEHSFTERFIDAIRGLRNAGAPTSEVLVQYILSELGYYPGVRIEEVGDPASLTAAGEVLQEVGSYVSEHGRRAADGEICISDAIVIEAHLMNVGRVVARERIGILKFIAEAEDLSVRQRVGPKRAPRFIENRRVATA